MKKHLPKIVIITAIVSILCITGYLIYWGATHTCIAWEEIPTGKVCVRYEKRWSLCFNGKTSTPCRKRKCVEYEPCRRCTQYVLDEEAPAKIIAPPDKC